ncbi:MAG TPA: hypothetical protein VIT19_04700, partial [Pyrinomonadaceae bacterium]
LRAMQGATEKTLPAVTAVLARNVKASPDRDSYLPAVLRTDEDGRLLAEPLKWGGSSDFVSFARANGLILVPAGASITPGDIAKCLRLPG